MSRNAVVHRLHQKPDLVREEAVLRRVRFFFDSEAGSMGVRRHA